MSRSEAELLTIGDLARRVGLTSATLRAWEQRHGFPRPERLPSGHRRYPVSEVERVRDVLRRREDGARLDAAITQALAVPAPDETVAHSGSVYAELRRHHPALAGHRLHKRTLTALSWAIEDEFCAKAADPYLFGAFQRREFYDASRSRWRELARVARATVVLADFDEPAGGSPVEVALGPSSPMHREWTVVCDARELSAALSAWELPGQDEVPDADRLFECVWTVDPRAVRTAARVCAAVALESGLSDAGALLYELADEPPAVVADLASVTTLFNRVVSYVDALR
ncbi:MAG TPA: DICT sensory domain-containing protein [Nocardioides sp.]|nr:DICT sensory domain-containing protein [Nocardioides sp.]